VIDEDRIDGQRAAVTFFALLAVSCGSNKNAYDLPVGSGGEVKVPFIGDGLTGTGSGAVQQFTVPAGATRVALGSSDTAGGNNNNSGQFDVTVSTF
jgi:hypothetical protein